MTDKAQPNVYGTQEEKRAFLDLVMLAAQRSRSMGAETMGVDRDTLMSKLMSDMFPITFPREGHIGIMDLLMAALKPGRDIQKIDIFNVLNMVERDDLIQTWMMHHASEVELPRGIIFMAKAGLD